MEADEVDSVLAMLAVGFPSLQVGIDTQVVWRLAMEQADADDVRSAALRFIQGEMGERNNAFAPSCAEVLAEVKAARKREVAEANETAMRLEADNRKAQAAREAEAQAVNVKEAEAAGYADSRAYLIDKKHGCVALPADAPYRYFDWRDLKIHDSREKPKALPMNRKGRGGPPTSIGDALSGGAM